MTTPSSGGYPRYGEEPQGGEPYPDSPGAYPASEGASYEAPDYAAAYGTGSTGDYSQFDVNSAQANQNALAFHGQQLADGYFGDGTQPHPINNPGANGWSHTKGTGRLRPGQAISWAFKAFGQNAGLWLVVGLVLSGLSLLASLPNINDVVAALASLASILVLPVALAAALQQTLVAKFSSPSTPAYGKTLGMLFLVGFIALVAGVFLIVVASLVGASAVDPAAIPADPEQIAEDEALMNTLVRSMGIAMAVICLLLVLLLPFVTYQMFYAADNNGSFGHAFGQALKAGARNWLPTVGLLLFCVLLGVLSQVPMFFTAGEGLSVTAAAVLSFLITIVVSPITLLAVAHAYRQVSGGPVPAAPEAAVR